MGNDDLGAAFANAKGGEVQPPPPSLDLEGNAFAATKVAVAPSPDLSAAFPPAPCGRGVSVPSIDGGRGDGVGGRTPP